MTAGDPTLLTGELTSPTHQDRRRSLGAVPTVHLVDRAPGQLSPRLHLLLRHGDCDHRYGRDGSRIVGAIVLDAVNNRCAREEIYRLLKDPQNKGGFACLRSRWPDLRRRFEREWERAIAKADASPLIEDRQEAAYRAQQFLESVRLLPWKGRAGSSDLAVYSALVKVAQRVGRTVELSISVRELAEQAGVTKTTSSASLRRLAARGLIRQVYKGHGLQPSRWTFLPPLRSIPDNLSHSGGEYVGSECPVDFAVDCWAWGAGLGKSKARVWECLGVSAVSTADLAAGLGVCVRTVQHHLRTLNDHGMARRVEGGWIQGPNDPTLVSEMIGAAGLGTKRRGRHARERTAYLLRLIPEVSVDPETGEVFRREEMLGRRPDQAKPAVNTLATPGCDSSSVAVPRWSGVTRRHPRDAQRRPRGLVVEAEATAFRPF